MSDDSEATGAKPPADNGGDPPPLAEPGGSTDPVNPPPAADPGRSLHPAHDETTADADATTADVDAAAADKAATAPPSDSRAGIADAGIGQTGPRRHRRKRSARPRRKAPWWELPALVLLAIGVAIVVKSFIVQPFYIPSESMEHTLHGCSGCSGDRILVNKPIYSVLRDPEAGDIVVFDAPDGWEGPRTDTQGNPIVGAVRGFGQLIGFVPPDGEVLVKRVIATGGQTVKGDATGRVMISKNGPGGPFRTLREPYVFVDRGDNSQPAFGPVTVPKGRLWVMGDHRNRSADSRYHCTPGGAEDTSNDRTCDPISSTVPDDKVIGKAFVIAWPPSRWDILGTPTTFEAAAAAAGPTLPVTSSALVVLPLLFLRRRRRRRS